MITIDSNRVESIASLLPSYLPLGASHQYVWKHLGASHVPLGQGHRHLPKDWGTHSELDSLHATPIGVMLKSENVGVGHVFPRSHCTSGTVYSTRGITASSRGTIFSTRASQFSAGILHLPLGASHLRVVASRVPQGYIISSISCIIA